MDTKEKEKKLTGYPSIDKPWLKYYSEEAINTPLPEGTTLEYIWEKNKDRLDDVALIYFGRKITYKMLFANIEKTGRSFSAMGVKSGDVVVLSLPNIPENVYCMYALNKLGAIADMVDLRSKGDILKHYFNESGATIAVVCNLFIDNVLEIISETNLKKVIVVSPFDSLQVPFRFLMKLRESKKQLNGIINWKSFSKLSKDISNIQNTGKTNDIACIFHTSGTSDTPKGVMISNGAFNAMAINVKLSGLNLSGIMMNQVPPFLAYNLLCALHTPLALHMQVILLPEYNPNKFAANIIKLKPNFAIAGPADWNNFLDNLELRQKDFDLSFLVGLISGSDAMIQKNKDEINTYVKEHGCKEAIIEGYGMTEIGAGACINLPQHNVDGSVGVPLPLNTFCIYDNDADKELPYESIGEICMRGPTVMKGYFKHPELSDKTLRKHKDGLCWLHSGDLGYMDKNGNLYLEGRLKRIIIRHDGIKISPFNLEKTIMKHKNIAACCVVGAFDKEHKMGQVPIAYIVMNNDDDKTAAEIENLIEKNHSVTYYLKAIVVLDHLPITPNGKINYRALEKLAEESKGGNHSVQ